MFKNKYVRFALIVVAILLLLLLLLFILIRIPAVQNYAQKKVLHSLSTKYDADWQIDKLKIKFFDEIEAEGILFLDQASDTLLAADQIKVDISLFSLLSKTISIDDISIQNAHVNLYELPNGEMNYSIFLPDADQDSSDAETNKSAVDKPWSFGFNTINLDQVKLSYQTTDLDLAIMQESLYADVDEIDFTNQIVSLDKLESRNTHTYVSVHSQDEGGSSGLLPDLGWTVAIDHLDMYQKIVDFDGEQSTQIKELTLEAQNLNYHADSLFVDINQLEGNYNDQIELREGSGQLSIYQDQVDAKEVILRTTADNLLADQLSIDVDSKSYHIKNLNSNLSYKLLKILEPYLPNDIKLIAGEKLQAQATSLSYDPQVLQFNTLDLQYGSALSLKGSMNMKAIQGDFQNPDQLSLNIDLLKADLQQVDGMLITYALPDSLQQYQYLTASGFADGNLQNLTVEQFTIKIDDTLDATLEGSIQNMNHPDDLSFDLVFDRMMVETKGLPYTSVESLDIQSLGQVNYEGRLSGDMTSIAVDGKLQSAIGDAEADVVLGFKDGLDSLSYNGDVALTEFDLGSLLKDESLGKITVTTEVAGKGTSLQDGNSKLKGVVRDFEYKGYIYQIITVDAQIQEGEINGVVDIDDPNAQLHYDGTIHLSDEASIFDFTMQIDTINLQQLNLYADEISLSGAIESKLSLPLASREQQHVLIKDLYLSNTTDHFYEDSIRIDALSKADSTYVTIDSDVMQLHLDGIYQVADLPASLNELMNAYLDTDTVLVHTEKASRHVHLYGQLNTLKPFNILLADHELQSKPMSIDIKTDFEQGSLVGEIEVDSFYFDDLFSEHLVLTAVTTDDAILINLEGDQNTYSGTPINGLTLTNRISNNNIESTLSAIDRFDTKMLELTAQSQYSPGATLMVIQDSLILNNKDWDVRGDNLIRIENNCFTVSNFELTEGLERVQVNSHTDGREGLSVVFESFEIGEFTDLLLNDGPAASGTINGEVDVRDLCTKPYFITNLAVQDIVYDSTAIGTLTISGDSDPANSLITSEISLVGPINNMEGSATYNTSTREIDVELLIDSLQLSLLDPVLEDVIKDSDGILSGEISMTGTTDKPDLKGFAKLHHAVTTVVANNTQYSLDDNIIEFDDSSIDIGVLDLYDEEGNSANLTGKIFHTNLKDMNFDLQLDTRKFIFLNTSARDNPVFFGKVYFEASGDITGPPSLLKVNVSARILKDTEITISPYSAETYLKEDFITYGKPEDFEDLTDEYLLQLAQQYPFDVTLLLDATEDAKLTLVVDPINGDKVEGYGNGNIKIQLNPDGEQEFYGLYTVKKGTYDFSYGDFIFKEFEIKEGGSVVFNGDLLNAIVDIDAVHNVYTSTYELVKDEVTLETSEFNNSKSRKNVEVYLTLAGPLDHTEIVLDIQIPNLESSSLLSPVERRLAELRSDPNELNNQVFGLLIFNSFILSQNSSNGIGNIGSNLALSSLSELVSSQLNNFASNYIKGVDVNINVNSYDAAYVNDGAGGNVTELGLQLSKQLFNDRLSVSATGNVDLEANDQVGYSTVVGDFVLEYKLTEDGRYRVRVFSKTDYDRLLNENNNKNGISLYFKKSFDSKRN